MSEVLVVLVLICIINIYFLPYTLAKRKGRNDRFWVFWVNLFIGWTILGWIGCIVWVQQDDE